jgi:hypothetical protein
MSKEGPRKSYEKKMFQYLELKTWPRLASFLCILEFSCVRVEENVKPWTNFSLQDEPWAKFTTLEVAACNPFTYCPV